MLSPVFALRFLVPVFGVVAVTFVVLRLDCRWGVRGAGVKSPSLSTSGAPPLSSSSSDDSATIFLRPAAARRVGLEGDIVDMTVV
jgi:hypothetical protein